MLEKKDSNVSMCFLLNENNIACVTIYCIPSTYLQLHNS